jgi:hypothetical protein
MPTRALSEDRFKQALETLAKVSASAFSLREDLAPLSPEDIANGAEPLSQEQINQALDSISNDLTLLALETLGATREEWFAANDTVQ